MFSGIGKRIPKLNMQGLSTVCTESKAITFVENCMYFKTDEYQFQMYTNDLVKINESYKTVMLCKSKNDILILSEVNQFMIIFFKPLSKGQVFLHQEGNSAKNRVSFFIFLERMGLMETGQFRGRDRVNLCK